MTKRLGRENARIHEQHLPWTREARKEQMRYLPICFWNRFLSPDGCRSFLQCTECVLFGWGIYRKESLSDFILFQGAAKAILELSGCIGHTGWPGTSAHSRARAQPPESPRQVERLSMFLDVTNSPSWNRVCFPVSLLRGCLTVSYPIPTRAGSWNRPLLVPGKHNKPFSFT